MNTILKSREIDDVRLFLGDKTGKATFKIHHSDGSTTVIEMPRDRAEALAEMIGHTYERWDARFGGKDEA